MVTRLEQVGDELGVRREVDPIDGRPGREAGPLDREQVEALRQRLLRRPRRGRADDAAVNEHEPLHRASLVPM